MQQLHLLTLMFLVFIVTQRLGELYIARINTKALLAKGAQEFGAWHYPIMVTLHSAWVICLFLFGYTQEANYFWLSLFAVLQFFRLWILTSLGERWTTRIIVLDEPLVLTGPFKYFRHPNYMLVVAEIFVAPMVLGLWQMAVIFSILNALMLFVRIREEEKALSHLRISD
jgi:methyltransferase